MASTLAKVAIATTGIAGVGGGATVAIIQLSTKDETIVNLLKQEQKSLLTKTEKDEAWKTNWKAFINAHTNSDPNLNWSIEGWSEKKADPESVPEEFKNVCYFNGNKKIKDKAEEIYGEVVKYCTENTITPSTQTVTELLKTDSKVILDKTSGSKTSWDKNWGTFKTAYQTLKIKEEWKFQELEETMNSTNEAPSAFKERCEANGKKRIANKQVPLYIEILKYCVDNP
ncbi:hypothetical protein A6V39_03475 [Candidatus Mycoplasma haematobovis]|uniref:Uncharacterized protein n=1 Tax=Candidatus Mycoplasma haematobovis TaxID=432608 RepID=A0A1A9QDB0_9MOLU|nr:hypothetical protein [Candidatus Mycoplasma haematobovis]OAL09946.1 hypothetical protein A6V39_03475 [Candidatus Mycoplasma haematobovis]